MSPNKTNTNQGTNVEHLFSNSITDHPSAFRAMCEMVGLDPLAYIEAEVIGERHWKTDVILHFDDYDLGCSIKSFTGPGYNHLERRTLPEFCRRNQIPSQDEAFLYELILRKQANPYGLFVQPQERNRVRAIFSACQAAQAALLGEDNPQVFVLFSVQKSRFHIYDMDRTVQPLVRSDYIGFTSQSANIEIGDYIVVQRKGSEKEASGRANDIQIKMKVRKFFNEVEPHCFYQL